MKKICVFCGATPIAKNREHVLPSWLLAMTGDPRRPIYFQVPAPPPRSWNRTYSFQQFTFPACSRCNGRFSALESAAQRILSLVLSNKPLSAQDISTLLDWFDKIRLGLWLGYRYLTGNAAGVSPNFYIEGGLARFDRALIIHRASEPGQRLTFVGANTLAFALMPSCVGLIVNHLYFISIATEYLLARRLGLPYPASKQLATAGQVALTMRPGRERIMQPVIKFCAPGASVDLYQPIFPSSDPPGGESQLHEKEYVRRMTLDPGRGLGVPLVAEGREIRLVASGEVAQCTPRVDQPSSRLTHLIQELVLRVQVELHREYSDDELPEPERRTYRRQLRNAVQINQALRTRLLRGTAGRGRIHSRA